jgi:hypothetical protein
MNRASVVTELEAKEPKEEERRLDIAVADLKASIDEMLEQGELAASGEHRDILEAYRMFAHDRGWLRRMKDAIKRGMTAEAASSGCRTTPGLDVAPGRSLLARTPARPRRIVQPPAAHSRRAAPVARNCRQVAP